VTRLLGVGLRPGLDMCQEASNPTRKVTGGPSEGVAYGHSHRERWQH
jgi:hypothetical protein